jgi:tetratricopeptide (TPR) repeat protein
MTEKLARKLSNKALSLLNGGKTEKTVALAHLRRAHALVPQDAAIKCNLAVAMTGLGHYTEASRLLSELVAANKSDLAAWHAYGVLSLVACLPEDAAACFKRCAELDPGDGDMLFNQSLALMQAGHWRTGLAAYEARRFWKPERSFPGLPAWQGETDRHVYVWAEQGVGDTFQFARYLPWLAARSKRVTFALPADLHGIFAGYEEVCDLVTLTADVAGVDCETSLMSLPFHQGMTADNVLPDPGLLGSKLGAQRPWEPTGNLRVGLCWACNPSSMHHRERSVPLAELLTLAQHGGIDLISLQVGKAAEDIVTLGARDLILDVTQDLEGDWAATASMVKSLDFIVTTDTSVAHLAAILEKPTIMLIARRDWWRWGNSGTGTFWYPTMTIIRQETPFSWSREIEQVSALVGKAAREHRAIDTAA